MKRVRKLECVRCPVLSGVCLLRVLWRSCDVLTLLTGRQQTVKAVVSESEYQGGGSPYIRVGDRRQ